MEPPTIKISNQPICSGRISPYQYGQFMEYLCNLFPGMWAEKLYDGNFEGLSPYKFEFIKETDFKEMPWYPSGAVNRASYDLDKDHPINGEVCKRITAESGSPATVGLSQDGIYAEPCKFSIWMKQSGMGGPVKCFLHDEGKELASTEFTPGPQWKKFTATLNPKSHSTNATFTIQFRGPGTLWLDAASLMPENAVSGWRPYVVKALKALKPGIIRTGGSVMDDRNLGDFQWTDTVGDPDFRKPFRSWGGLQPTGPGLEEFVQLCQMVQAEPLICVRFTQRTPKDAADEVEYFNGDLSTSMGAFRAKNGHAKPYHVKFWQVGNEVGGPEYESKLADFCKAMKAVDPSIKLLSSFPSEGVIKNAGSIIDYTCPHHYDCEDLVGENGDFTNLRKLISDNAPGRSIKLGITEWNTTAGDRGLKRARLWTLENALACSRYQNLMHRNCDLVEIANRSNMTNSFCSGILQTDNHRIYMTPTYYAQMLYSNYAGTRPLQISPEAPLKEGLDTSATLSEDGRELTLFVVNEGLNKETRNFDFSEIAASGEADIWTLMDKMKAGEPDVTNDFGNPERVAPVHSTASCKGHALTYTFEPLSLTVIRLKREPSSR